MPPERHVEQTLCRMCEERCGIDVCLENGRIVEIVGNKDHRWNHGHVCVKARAAMEMIYHPDRVLTPLKRTADGWQEISLDQALDEIAAHLVEIKQHHGARSVAAWSGEALGFAQQEKLARRFLQAFGSPNFLSPDALCWASRFMSYGIVDGAWPLPDFENARCIVLWGANPPHSHPTMAQDIIKAQRRGASLVVVDPRRSAIARRADIHAAVRPGTDGALAWGLVHLLVGSGGYDKEFVQRHVLGFSKVAEYARAFTPEAVEAETGVSAATVRAMARTMQEAMPRVAAWMGLGLEHHESGFNNLRVVAMLDALLGSLDHEGGNRFRGTVPLQDLTLYGEATLEEQRPLGAERFPLLYEQCHDCNTMTALGSTIDGEPYPLRALIVTGADPALSNPNSARVLEALEALDLLVVRDLFMSETAAVADYVLPAASFLERSELHAHARHQIVSLTRRIVSWPDVQNEYEFWRDLAARAGIGECFPWEDETALNRWLLEPTGLSLEELEAHPEGVEYPVPRPRGWEATGFATPSGKVEFTSAHLNDLGYDEIPVYRSPAYQEMPCVEYPLVLISGARKLAIVPGGFRTTSRSRTVPDGPGVEMHREDAAALGVVDGEVVRVKSRIGSIELPARVVEDGEIPAGIVQIAHGWPKANVNLLTHDDRLDPISGFPLMRAVEVRVDKVAGCADGGRKPR
jgi:anaerobic selenocysteine-containing dehydrogenase